MATKKKKKDKQPKVPSAQAVPTLKEPSEPSAPKYAAMTLKDFEDWTRKAYDLQLGYAPAVTEAQRQAQDVLFRNMSSLQREQGAAHMAAAHAYNEAYNPEFRQQYGQQIANLAKQRGATDVLGANVTEDLASKYDLGPGLSREMEQAIRGAQTARGNILGAAPTAQEAFGKGKASIDLYNQRLAQYNQYLGQQQGVVGTAQNFLQGRNPMDMMSQTAGTFFGSNYYPSQAYVDTGLGAQSMANVGGQQQSYNQTVMSGYNSFQNALQNYNQNLISGTNVTNEGIFNQYDRTAEAWQYREAVRRGLYSTPQVGGAAGGGGMMGGMGGTLMKGIGGGVTTGLGLAAAGTSIAGLGVTGTALAGGAAAAVSAAGAAICWLARSVIPERWEDFRAWLFTKAPDNFRRAYIYNGRRWAREMSREEKDMLRPLMLDLCLR